MAVLVHAPLPYSTSNMWNPADAPDDFATTGSEEPSTSPGYQYPLPSTSIIPGFHDLPPEPVHSNSPSEARQDSPGIRNRGSAAVTKSSKIKRSMSTPNVRGQASADAAAMALTAEKRRNKLGYHRTSVACGHCRRRKIRCIPAPADAQNRCTNCIRLKKECNFFPVEQQPPQQDPKRRDSKPQSSTGGISESSSPSTASGQLPEGQSALPYPQLSMPASADLGGPPIKRQRTESFSPDNNKIATSSRGFDYNNHGHTNWMAPEASPSTRPPNDAAPFWRINPHASPMTPGFSPFTPGLTPHSTWSAQTEPSSRDEMPWSVPQRSISFSNLEGLPSQHHNPYPQYPPPMSDHYGTKPRVGQGTMYPPPISTSTSSHAASDSQSASTNSASQHSHSSLPSGSISSASSYNSWQHPYVYPKHAGEAAFSPWHNSHGGQGQVSEGGGSMGSAHYGYGEPGTPLFYPPPPPPPSQGR